MVNIALGNAALMTCAAGDANHDNEITIDEILTAVRNALNGCAAACGIWSSYSSTMALVTKLRAAGYPGSECGWLTAESWAAQP
jgi:hypothetical protein